MWLIAFKSKAKCFMGEELLIQFESITWLCSWTIHIFLSWVEHCTRTNFWVEHCTHLFFSFNSTDLHPHSHRLPLLTATPPHKHSNPPPPAASRPPPNAMAAPQPPHILFMLASCDVYHIKVISKWTPSSNQMEECDPRDVSGAKPTIRKWHVTSLMVANFRWFKSPTVTKRYTPTQFQKGEIWEENVNLRQSPTSSPGDGRSPASWLGSGAAKLVEAVRWTQLVAAGERGKR